MAIQTIAHFKMNVWADLESFYRSELAATVEKFGSDFTKTCVRGIWVVVHLEKCTGYLTFPAMAVTYKLDFSWMQKGFVHFVLPIGRKEMTLENFMKTMEP